MNESEPNRQNAIVREKGLIPEPVKLALILVLLLAVIYLFYDRSTTRKAQNAEISGLKARIAELETSHKVATAAFVSKISDLESKFEQAFGNTQKELRKASAELRAESP